MLLSKSSANYRIQPRSPQHRRRKKKKPTRISQSVSLSREVFEEGKISFQWSLAETEGISLRSGQRLTVNSDVRTHGVWQGCVLACERANERVAGREREWGREERAREGGGKGWEGGKEGGREEGRQGILVTAVERGG